MSLKKNIVANYASQAYVTLIGIVMVPLYVRYMGAEAYGLVGFFTMMQAWFQLLDLGLTPTMARASAQYRGGASDALTLRRLLRALEGVFIGGGVVAAIVIVCMSDTLATRWLHVQKLPVQEVRHALMLMGVIVALRWIAGLYRGAINGFEHMVWLSGFNIAVATVRFVLVMPLLVFVAPDPVTFFRYQLVVAVVELVVLVAKTYRLLPAVDKAEHTAWSLSPLKGVLKFSLSIAFTSSIWVLVSQTDKLVLSRLLPLTDYAYFTLAVLMAGGVSILSGPVSMALLPRLTRIATEGDDAGFVQLYRTATQLIGVVTMPAAIVLALFSEQILWVWTGDSSLANKAAPVLALYALGNGVLGLAAFPYYLQYAKGDLRLHLSGNALFVVFFIPSLIIATVKFGTVGAGYAWLGANLSYFFIWVPVVHRKFAPGLHTQWFSEDIAKPLIAMLLVAFALRYSIALPQARTLLFASLLVVGLVLVAISAFSSGLIRGRIRSRFAVNTGP